MNLLELHILQSFPVTCLNRDDVGSPKTAYFGGVQRARVSSQSWKRAIRLLMKEKDEHKNIVTGVRTRLLKSMLKEEFDKYDLSDADKENYIDIIISVFDDKKKDKDFISTLIYVSQNEIKQIVEFLMEDPATNADKKKLAKSLKKYVLRAIDIFIFGRMVASSSSPIETIEGSGLFSHALSTHAVANEVDFFAAVDDKNDELDNAGSGHIGTIEYSSATYYRYIGLNLDLLKENLKVGQEEGLSSEEFKNAIKIFVEAVIEAVPEARRNSMFGYSLPQYTKGIVRTGQPLSLINAFEKPITGSKGYMEKSVKEMNNHFSKLKTFDLNIQKESEINLLAESPTKYSDFISELLKAIKI